MIVDIFMPHMRGFESIRIFHERAPTVPLIAMSGYAFANLDSPAPDFLRMALETGNAVPGEGGVGAKDEVSVGDDVMVAVNASGHGACGAHPDRTFIDLNLVQDLIGQSNGDVKICCEARQGTRGTSVKIYLPRARSSVRPRAEECQTGNGTIPIVEDDTLVRNYVVAQVQGLGYRTLCASNASEALAIFDSGESIDLLFADVVLPGSINGRRLAIEARNRRPSLKVLYTSGYAENALIHDGCLDADALLLAKPCRKTDLAKMIRVALAPDTIQNRN